MSRDDDWGRSSTLDAPGAEVSAGASGAVGPLGSVAFRQHGADHVEGKRATLNPLDRVTVAPAADPMAKFKAAAERQMAALVIQKVIVPLLGERAERAVMERVVEMLTDDAKRLAAS